LLAPCVFLAIMSLTSRTPKAGQIAAKLQP
jgi:hypothetical protein